MYVHRPAGSSKIAAGSSASCLSPSEAEVLGEHIRESLAGSKSKLVMDLKQLRWDQVENLQPLRDKLAMYRSRIRIVLPKVSLAHPELILLAAMFEAATR